MPYLQNISLTTVDFENCYGPSPPSKTNATDGDHSEWWLTTSEPATAAILSICAVISAVNIVFGLANLLAVISIATIKKLHTPLNMYAACIAGVDTVMIATVLPVHFAQLILTVQGGVPVPPALCKATSFLKPLLVVCSCTSKLVIASVQARAVGSSVGHLNRYQVNMKEIAFISGFQVALGIAIATVVVSHESVGYICCIHFHYVGRLEKPPFMFAKPSSWYTWAIVPVVSGISVASSLICYAFIYCKLAKNRFPLRQCSTDSRLSGKKSKAELFTVKTAFMLVVVYIICYLPSLTLGIIRPDMSYLAYWYLASTLFEFHSCLNPFLYLWGSPRYRKIVRNELRNRFCGCSFCSSHRSTLQENNGSRFDSTKDLDTKELSSAIKFRKERFQGKRVCKNVKVTVHQDEDLAMI